MKFLGEISCRYPSGTDLFPLPHESTLSILWRFGWRNALSAPCILSYCSRRNYQSKGLSFLSPSWIDPYAFHAKTGWTVPHPMETEFDSKYKDALVLWFSTKLRYCPICLEDGYHSLWHQFLLLVKCPRHGCLIQSTCQSCGKKLPEYRLTVQLFKRPYFCRHCHAPICGVEVSLERHLNLRAHQEELSAAFSHLHQWAESMRPTARFIRALTEQNSGWKQEWSYWCRPVDFLHSIGHQVVGLPDDCIVPSYPDITLISWKLVTRFNSRSEANLGLNRTSYLIRGAEPVYRATLRILYKWIFPALVDDQNLKIWESLPRDSSGTINIQGIPPERAAFFLLRQLMEEQLVSASAADFYNVSIRSEAFARICLHEYRTPRLAWRALFLGMFASLYQLIDRAKKTGEINIRTMQINERSLVARFYRSVGFRKLEGGVVFPKVPGLPIKPFKNMNR